MRRCLDGSFASASFKARRFGPWLSVSPSLSDVEVVSLWDGHRRPATRFAQTRTIRSVRFLISMALWRDARHRAGRVEIASSLTDMHVSDWLVNREKSHFLRINCKSSCAVPVCAQNIYVTNV